MSDTPKTDGLELPANFWNGLVVPADFARQLERELAAARAELAKYKENLQEMSNDWAASDEKLRAELERAMRVVRAGVFWKKHDAPVGGSAWALLGAVEEWEAGR